MAKLILPIEINLMRIIAQGLASSMRFPSVREVTSHLLAAQAQSVFAWGEAMALRTPANPFETTIFAKPSPATECSFIRSRPMRGTLHITLPEDYHLMRLACYKRESYYRRNEAALGLDEKFAIRAFGLAETHISAEGPATKDDLRALWLEHGLMRPEDAQRMTHFLLFRLDSEGLLAQGFVPNNRPYFVVVKNLRRPEGSLPEMQAEVARRYAYSRGPVQIDDFARWSGISVKAAGAALSSAVRESRGELTTGHLDNVTGRLVEDKKETRESFYFRTDIFDLLSQKREEALAKFLLPPWDELHNGYKNRSCLCDEAGEKLICPARNGTNLSILMEHGRLQATYRKTKDKYYYL